MHFLFNFFSIGQINLYKYIVDTNKVTSTAFIICEPNPGSPRPESNIPEVVREAFKYHLQYLLLAGIGVVFSLLFLLLFVLSSHLGNKLISLM